MTVGAVAAHLGRALFNVERYLDATPADPPEEPISAASYFASILKTSDLEDPLHVDVRARSAESAAEGWEALVTRFDDALGSLRARLTNEDRTRKLRVLGGLVMHLDDYLATRLVECVVHADDLAVSVGSPTPDFDPGVVDLAISHMVDVARLRHGDLSVIRALSRRERDEFDALRVF
jgi:hypothetical protein